MCFLWLLLWSFTCSWSLLTSEEFLPLTSTYASVNGCVTICQLVWNVVGTLFRLLFAAALSELENVNIFLMGAVHFLIRRLFFSCVAVAVEWFRSFLLATEKLMRTRHSEPSHSITFYCWMVILENKQSWRTQKYFEWQSWCSCRSPRMQPPWWKPSAALSRYSARFFGF